MTDVGHPIPLSDPLREAALRDPILDPRTDRERVESVKHFLAVELPARRAYAERQKARRRV